MFVHDPLLFAKHPQQYLRLFFTEGHYQKTKEFWSYFLEGIKHHRVNPPLEILVNELEQRDPDFWTQVNVAIRGDYRKSGDLFFSESDLAAVRLLLGMEEAPEIPCRTATAPTLEN